MELIEPQLLYYNLRRDIYQATTACRGSDAQWIYRKRSSKHFTTEKSLDQIGNQTQSYLEAKITTQETTIRLQ